MISKESLLDYLKHFPKDQTSLEIDSLDLIDEIPEGVLPDWLVEIIVDGCPTFHCFPKRLPAMLQSIVCYNLPNLEELPASLPEGFLHLTLRNCKKVRSIPPLPSSMISLDVTSCDFHYLPDVSQTKMKSLLATDNPHLRVVSDFPDTLEQAYFSGCSALADFPSAPNSLIEVDISGTAIRSIKRLSPATTTLYAAMCPDLEGLPQPFPQESLLRLDLHGSPLIDWLPEELPNAESVSAGGTAIVRFPSCPKLRDADVTGCLRLQTLGDRLSPVLERLWMDYCRNVKSLPPLPQIMKSLKVHHTGLAFLQNIPPDCVVVLAADDVYINGERPNPYTEANFARFSQQVSDLVDDYKSGRL